MTFYLVIASSVKSLITSKMEIGNAASTMASAYVAGHVVNETRSSLLSENVNMLVFLSVNLGVNKNKN